MSEHRLDGPPGALPRLRNETFADSRKIYEAAVKVIDWVGISLRRHHPDSKEPDSKEGDSFELESSTGAKVRWNRFQGSDGISGTQRVIVALPSPSGQEEYDFLHNWSKTRFLKTGSYGENVGTVQITRRMSQGKNRHTEECTVSASELNYRTERKPTLFSTSRGGRGGFVETSHSSVIDPAFILDKIKQAFPQLAQ